MKLIMGSFALLALIAARAEAGECAIDVDATDSMQYSVKSITVPKSCKTFDITLKHTGKLPKQIMGHNFVVGLSSNQEAIISDGAKAGPTLDYVKPNDPHVVAATKLIGGGESATVAIPVSKLDPSATYTFFCSFPGHAVIMKGTLKVGT